MYIKRNVYFSAIDQETGEEKLFCVNEVLDEATYLERLYSEGEDEKKSIGLKTAGKAALIGGAGVGIAGGIGENAIAHKIAKNAANKYGVERTGFGANQAFFGVGKKTAKEVGNIASRAIRQNKGFKLARRADGLGTAAALAGGGMLVANKIMNKKKDKE